MTDLPGARLSRVLPALALLLAACQPASRPENASEQVPAAVTSDRPQIAADQRLYELDPLHSQVEIVVRREGALARLGHDHAIVAAGAEGYLLLNADNSVEIARLWLHPARWQIDPADARTRYGLDTNPDADDIEGTRRNLLTRVLDAEKWPVIGIEGFDWKVTGEEASATLLIDIEGRRVSLPDKPFQFAVDEEVVTASGTFRLRQTELGLEPFSVLGGGLKVADEMTVAVRLTGRRK